jgi:hypothetical protein
MSLARSELPRRKSASEVPCLAWGVSLSWALALFAGSVGGLEAYWHGHAVRPDVAEE